MLKSFALWFVCFGLSFLIESWGWTEQGKAFLYIFLIVVFSLIIITIVNVANKHSTEAKEIYLYASKITVMAFAILFVAIWVVTKLFNIDFYVANQIMTFALCLASKSKINSKL